MIYPKLLAIESSGEACSVALSINGEIHEKFEQAPMRHAELLLPMVRSLVAAAGLQLSDMDAIAFGRGPGSFTSLRIGVGVVQGLAWGAGLPVVPVSSLAALAQAAVEQGLQNGITRICVAVDARMQEVYTGSFEIDGGGLVIPVSREAVCPPASVQIERPELNCGAGNGYARYPELEQLGAELAACLVDCWPRAGTICRLVEGQPDLHPALPAEQAQPVYIRDKVADKPRLI